MKPAESKIFGVVTRTLRGVPDYEGEAKAAFDDLVVRLLRFVSTRADAARSRFPYLSEIVDGHEPKEATLQRDLYDFLASAGFPVWERDNVASGRADIVFQSGLFNFVIETKCSTLTWENGSAPGFAEQATAHQQTDIRLGVLAVLDLSARPAGDPHLSECFFVHQLTYSGQDRLTVLVVRLPGNKRTPSDQ